MNMKLFLSAMAKFALGVVLLGVLIFLPAGTMHYPQGWLLMGILFIPMFIAGLVMMAKNPDLLRSRLNAKEKRGEQSRVVKLSGLMFLAGFVAAGLSFRFGWVMLPAWVSIAGAVLFLLAYALYAEVLRENAWLSRTIEVQKGQQVVSTGLVWHRPPPHVCGDAAALPVHAAGAGSGTFPDRVPGLPGHHRRALAG